MAVKEQPALERSLGDIPAWMVILAVAVAVALAEWRRPLGITAASLTSLIIASCALGAGSAFYRHLRKREHLAVMCTAMIHMLLFSAAGAVLSYLLAREGGALWDDRFQAWDRALGFDWLGYARFVDSHVWIATPFRIAYASLIPQIVVIVLALGFTRRMLELRSVIFAAMLCGTIVILLSPLFPAVSNFVHLGLSPADFRNVNPWAGYTHLADYEALRSGAMGPIDLKKMQGIITFPSYHAGLATVTLWGFTQCPSKVLRWGGATIALATIAATPVDGGHYLVDVIAGVAIALASIVAARRIVPWAMRVPVRSSPFRRLRAAPAQ
jgi:hypothetical protein